MGEGGGQGQKDSVETLGWGLKSQPPPPLPIVELWGIGGLKMAKGLARYRRPREFTGGQVSPEAWAGCLPGDTHPEAPRGWPVCRPLQRGSCPGQRLDW